MLVYDSMLRNLRSPLNYLISSAIIIYNENIEIHKIPILSVALTGHTYQFGIARQFPPELTSVGAFRVVTNQANLNFEIET